MGRDTTGVRGMNVADKDNAVLAMDVARDRARTCWSSPRTATASARPINEYRMTEPRRQGREDHHAARRRRALLAGALVVREHEELVFISQNGMVQRTPVRGINRYGRASQGVNVMNLSEDDSVSAVALVVESESATTAAVPDEEPPIQIDAEGDGEPGTDAIEPVSEDTEDTPTDDQDAQETT